MCPGRAHDRENLGLGGRRVLASRHWSGKTLKEHAADRAAVVRETLTAAGIDAPDADRLAADTVTDDGQPASPGKHSTPPTSTTTPTPPPSSPASANATNGESNTAPLNGSATDHTWAVDNRSATPTPPLRPDRKASKCKAPTHG